MRRSTYRRASARPGLNRRVLAAVATLVAFGGLITVTQISNAETKGAVACETPAPARPGGQDGQENSDEKLPVEGEQAPGEKNPAKDPAVDTYIDKNGAKQHKDDGRAVEGEEAAAGEEAAGEEAAAGEQAAGEEAAAGAEATASPEAAAGEEAAAEGEEVNNATTLPAEDCEEGDGGDEGDGGGQDNSGQPEGQVNEIDGEPVGAKDCTGSNLKEHNGFQADEPTCSKTAIGEIPSKANIPQLFFDNPPRSVRANQDFTLRIFSKNLFRGRFLPAAKGGYYRESSRLQDGIVNGHFHTRCGFLQNVDGRLQPDAPDAAPAFFVATEDNKGGRDADIVQINIPALNKTGTLHCMVWSGDASHRAAPNPFANQPISADAVRINVR